MSNVEMEKRRHSISEKTETEIVGRRPNQSQIVEFYKGRCVLVTGASGFLGKLIIEKLLRTCAGIKKIFLLIRPKKNKSASERLEDLLSSVIFNRLKSERNSEKLDSRSESFEQLKSKLVVLEGSLNQPGLGLGIERLLQISDEVSVIIHSAAVVSFVGKLRLSVDANLAGTHNVLSLASKLPKLCALIHVSTCYSNCTRKSIGEHLYPVGIEPLDLLELVKSLEDDALEITRRNLIGAHPNNYTYTKQLAEYLCGQFVVGQCQLPVLVCRPSIIISTHSEPIKGFVDNRNAGNGFLDGISRGLLRTVNGDEKVVMDLIPADFVSNCVIASAWFADLYHRVRLRIERPPGSNAASRIKISDQRLEQKMLKYYLQRKDVTEAVARKLGLDAKLAQVPVINVSSGAENPIKYGRVVSLICKHTSANPSWDLFRRPACSMTRNRFIHHAVRIMKHTFIGRLMDLFCEPPRPQMIAGGLGQRSTDWTTQFRRCDLLVGVLSFFFLNGFKFEPSSRVKMIDEFMNDADRREFLCDVRVLNWDSYFRDITLGIRRHLIGEPDETLPVARDRFKATQKRNFLCRMLFISILLGLCYWLIS